MSDQVKVYFLSHEHQGLTVKKQFVTKLDFDAQTKELEECRKKLKVAVEALEKFITKSNGLSFYVRDEYEKSSLEITDKVNLVEKLESLYDFQCEAEQTLKQIRGENG